MGSSQPTVTARDGAPEELLRSFIRGERGAKLRSQLATLHPAASAEEVEDAIQAACDRFVDKAEGISAPGQVYAWLRTSAHRLLSREDEHRHRESAVDPITDPNLQQVPAKEPTPEEETIELEDEAELAELVREISASLPERKRDVLALYGAGYKRPEIATQLKMGERAVKRDLMEIMDKARAAIARKSGGGCLQGEPLVIRFAYGLAGAAEAKQARFHMKSCRRCEVLWERIDAWRDKAAALLPVPAVEQASPGVIGRVAHRAADGLTAIKQQVLGGASQVKHQVASGYSRTVDPTPLTGVRPGTVAALLVSCATIGGGAATYCAQQDVNPLSAATGLLGGSDEEQIPTDPSTEPPEPVVVVPSPEPPTPVAEEPADPAPAPEPAPTPEPEPQPSVEAQAPAEAQPASEPAPPPPEQSFEPASPDYPAAEVGAESATPESTQTESTKPARVSGGSPQFGGP